MRPAAIILTVVIALAAGSVARGEVTDEQVTRAIERGVKAILKAQMY